MQPMATRERPTSGNAFIDSVRSLPWREVEARVFDEIDKGHMPAFMRRENFRPVTVSAMIDGRQVTATFRVSQDYISVSTDQGPVRMPLTPIMAQRIAARLGCALPTFRMVDAIDEESKKEGGYQRFYAAPDIARRVTDPQTNRPLGDRWDPNRPSGRWMTSPEFALEQSRMVDEDVSHEAHPDALRSGHKKDIVYHPEAQRRGNVAIYHRGIQGLNYVSHDNGYEDYSHGARLVDPLIPVTIKERDGTERTEQMQLAAILSGRGDPPYNHLYQLFSEVPMDIGAIYRPPAPRAAAAAAAPAPRSQVPRKRQPPIKVGEINQ